MRDLLQSAIKAEEEASRGRDVKLAAPDDLPLALVDHSLIEQAVSKLLANAGSYTPANLPIEITAFCTDGQLIISLSDRGPGFSDEPERAFEKFYRGNGNTTGGLGLGLSIARGFVEAHGGKLVAKNRKEGGARFTIELPVRLMERSALETGP